MRALAPIPLPGGICLLFLAGANWALAVAALWIAASGAFLTAAVSTGAAARPLNLRPHVAQSVSKRRAPIDGRTTRHARYAASIRPRERIDEAFGWIKAIAGPRKTKLRRPPVSIGP